MFLKLKRSFSLTSLGCIIMMTSLARLSKAEVDTLGISLDVSHIKEVYVQRLLMTKFDSIVQNFNKKDMLFKFKIQAYNNEKSICIQLSDIKYVSLNRNLWTIGLDISFLIIDYLIFPFPPVLPFYLLPATYSKLNITLSPDLKFDKLNIKRFIHPSGFAINKEKQTSRFVKSFDKVITQFFKKIGKKYLDELS